MRILSFILIVAGLLFSQSGAGYKIEPVFDYTHTDTTIVDEERNRALDLTIYIPFRQHGERIFPVIIFSPDPICGDIDYEYLFETWAKAGIITVVVFHPGNAEDLEREVNTVKYVQALERTSEYVNRPNDIKFLLKELFWNRIECIRGLADIRKTGAAGHSLGTHTALSLAGQYFSVRDSTYVLKDKMIKAVLGMSGQGPDSFGLTRSSWDEVSTPAMLMFGTSDRGVGIHSKADRRWAYEHITSDDKFFVSISGATKCVFSGVEKRGFRKIIKDPRHHQWIKAITTAYWKYIFKDDEFSLNYLKSGEIEKLSYKECKIDFPGKTDE
ncbi:MAG: hypothetical protein SCALA702_12690 [Melioribacteraceae bacterium]|nr:MAG: hypothetical protein SCALA702_12690 [Melioribacteraceae bacterium]